MRRRTLLQALLSTVPAASLARVRLGAQVRDLTPEAIATLREVAATVLPASIGADRVSLIVDRFVAWTKDYEEGWRSRTATVIRASCSRGVTGAGLRRPAGGPGGGCARAAAASAASRSTCAARCWTTP